MRRTLQITFLGLAALTAAACGKERITGGGSDSKVAFGIEPTIVAGGSESIGQVATRAKVDGTFPAGSIIGLGIAADGTTLPSFYSNFFAQMNTGAVGVWYYYLNGVNNGMQLAGFANWGNIQVYGYYPYNSAVTDVSDIPFRIATLSGAPGEATATDADVSTDYMVSNTGLKNMTTNTPAGNLSLQFRHLMTAIELRINRSNGNIPMLKLDHVTYTIDSGRSFIVSGTYTAHNPDLINLSANITPGDAASTLAVSYPSSANISGSSVSTRLLVIMPELRQTTGAGGADDATVTLTFSFTDQDNGAGGSHYEFQTFPGGDPVVSFKLSDITNTGDDNGLLAGYTYAVTATIATYTQFLAPTTGTPMPPHVNFDPLVDDPNDILTDI